MDCIDLSILKCLKENSRQTASMISQSINLSVSAVIERLRKMEPPRFGTEFVESASSHANVSECYYIAGDVDYLLKITTDTSRNLETIHEEIKEMPGVSWTKTLYVISSIKNDVSVLPDAV